MIKIGIKKQHITPIRIARLFLDGNGVFAIKAYCWSKLRESVGCVCVGSHVLISCIPASCRHARPQPAREHNWRRVRNRLQNKSKPTHRETKPTCGHLVGPSRRHHQIGRVAQWITRLPTEQKIPGSNPGALKKSFFIH